MNWYEGIEGVRVYTELPQPTEEPEKPSGYFDNIWLEEKLRYYQKQLYEEWDKAIRLPIPQYTAYIEDRKSHTEYIRRLELVPEKYSYAVDMTPEMYDYCRKDAEGSMEMINYMLDKAIVYLRNDLKEDIVQCLKEKTKRESVYGTD